MKRIFQIGFNRCGTSSLTVFLRDHNIPAVHWHDGKLAMSIEAQKRAGLDPVAGYGAFQAFLDMEYIRPRRGVGIEAYKYYRYFHEWYPDAYFILNTRNVFDWLRSRKNHNIYLKRYQRHYGGVSPKEVLRRWMLDWYRHHHDVLEFFADKPNLIVFDIDRHDPAYLCERLKPDFELDPGRFPHIGAMPER